MLDRPEFQSRRPGFRLCDSGDRRPFQLAPDSFSPVDRDLGFATICRYPRRHLQACFSPVDRDLGFATWNRRQRTQQSEAFQSRRPGFRLCDVLVRVLVLIHNIGFSPVDRDLGFATLLAALGYNVYQ